MFDFSFLTGYIIFPMQENRKNFIQQREMKVNNLSAVLNVVLRGYRSKRQIQHETGFSWGTVSGAVTCLEDSGILESSRTLPEGVHTVAPPVMHGRNSYYSFASARNLCIGMEIRPDSIRSCLITPEGEVLSKTEFRMPGNPCGRNLGKFMRLAFEEILSASGRGEKAVCSMGVALTGAFDREHLVWISSPHIPGIRNCDLSGIASDYQNLKVLMFEHDIVSKARAVTGTLSVPEDSFVFCHIGEGLGMTVHYDGAYHEGSRGFAGEIGHIPCPPAPGFPAVRCACGQTGCLETCLSLRGLRMFAGKKFGERSETLLKKHSEECYEFLRPYLIQLGVTAVNLYDPKLLIFGGEAVEPFLDGANMLLKDIQDKSWLHGPEKLLPYRMSECNASLGAALGPVDVAIRMTVRDLIG